MPARDDDEEFDLGISLESVAAIVDAARARTGPTRGAISGAELLPPGLHRKLLEADPEGVATTRWPPKIP